MTINKISNREITGAQRIQQRIQEMRYFSNVWKIPCFQDRIVRAVEKSLKEGIRPFDICRVCGEFRVNFFNSNHWFKDWKNHRFLEEAIKQIGLRVWALKDIPFVSLIDLDVCNLECGRKYLRTAPHSEDALKTFLAVKKRAKPNQVLLTYTEILAMFNAEKGNF